MAIVTRVSGDAHGVVNVDVGISKTGIGGIISTGVAKRPTAFKIMAIGAGGAVDLRGEMGVNGAVEAILRVVALTTNVIMYQVENTNAGQLSVVVEGNGWATDADLQAAVRALGATVGAGPVDLTQSTVSSAGGLKLA